MMTTVNGYEMCNLKAMEDFALAHYTEEATVVMRKLSDIQKKMTHETMKIARFMECERLSETDVELYGKRISDAWDEYHRQNYFNNYRTVFWNGIKDRFCLFGCGGNNRLITMKKDLELQMDTITEQVNSVSNSVMSTLKSAQEALHDASGMLLQKKEKEEA